MGKIKDDIKTLSKDAGSKSRAATAARQWYDKGAKSVRESAVAKTSDQFKTGMIYVFRYEKPKHIETLPWWDKNPVVLALDPTDNGNDLGINLNLLPPDIKEDLLDMVYERMRAMIKAQTKGPAADNAIIQRGVKLEYKGAKKFLKQYGFDFAIRQYIPQLKSNQKVVSYENWAKIALCDFLELEGITISELKAQFSNYLKNKDI
jgi:hypothetical protein